MIATVKKIALPTRLRLMPEGAIRIPMLIDEFFDFAQDCEYKVEYRDGQIISMGQTTMTHEQLVLKMGQLLANLLDDQPEFTVYGSNTGLYIPGLIASYSPDLVVIQGEPELVVHQRKRKAKLFTNPFLVVEVLSTGTKDFDLSEKLPDYQKILGLKHILFVSQFEPFVRVYSRTTQLNAWLNTNVEGMSGIVEFGEWELEMKKIYKKVF